MAPLTSLQRTSLALMLFLGSVAGLPSRAPAATRADASLEYKVKAAYLLNFTRYVEWPASAFTTPTSPIEICILGADPFGAVLERTVANRLINGRRIEIRRQSQADERLHFCHVLFISRSESEQLGSILGMLKDKPILTVSESKDFLTPGGMIHLLIANGSVHFEINSRAASQVGLKLSSRMLPLAKRVISGGG